MHLAVSNDRLRLDAVEVECPQPVALRPQKLSGIVLQLQLRLQIGRRRHFGGIRGSALQPCARGAVGQLSPVAHQGAIDTR